MRVILFTNASAAFATQSWTADDDYVIQGVVGGAGIISDDPKLTFTNFFTSPSAVNPAEKFVLSSGDLAPNGIQLNIPLSKGSTIYCAHSNTIEQVQLLVDKVSDIQL